ncbi:hypothetical protein CLOM_g6247 [Closterium sp. NIES-68]|nr:hypothetical protein CLOM_g6247 [Closterium sp. NIES-68]GJP81495.1 hypothetical protein CLOP_g11641 [Closterium sp. NIES-67]
MSSSQWPLLVAAGIGGFAVGCFWGHLISSARWRRAVLELQAWQADNAGGGGGRNSGKAGKGGVLLELDNMARQFEDFKMVLVVRNDLKMGKGKIGAQCGHATLGLYKRLAKRAPTALERWDENGQVKVVVRVDSEEELIILQDKAKKSGLPTHITIDAGRTQIEPNSKTVMAIIGPQHIVSDITGHLKLL